MHISLGDLKHQPQPIDLLEIVSLEGRYYIARVYLDGHCYGVTDKHDEVIRYAGAAAAREDFNAMEVLKTEVITPAGTDEMIGMPEHHLSPMKVPL